MICACSGNLGATQEALRKQTVKPQASVISNTIEWLALRGYMRARLPLLYSVLAFAILMGPQAARVAAQDKRAAPPSAKDLVGIWIGFDSDQLTFTRLDLRLDSTGFCARVSPADTILHAQGVHVYRVTKWTVNGWNIEIQMSPESNATGVGYVKGRIGLASIRLTIGGPENGGWKEEPFLHPEPRIMTSNQETREGIEQAEKNADLHPAQPTGPESLNAGTALLGWHKVDAGPFSILAPPRWEFHQLDGADSYIGEFVGNSIVLRFDYGGYSNPLKEERKPIYVVIHKSIDGHAAKIVSPRVPGHGITGVYFRNAGNASALTLFGKDLTPTQQELALKIFETLRFGGPPPRYVVPPPPPQSVR